MTIFCVCNALQALSPAGRCKSFDASADGYGRGEGFVVLVMAPPGSSRAAQQPLAVIRGSAVNQDGRSSSLTAPNGPSQSKLIGSALAAEDIQPHRMSMIAVHGTGTRANNSKRVQMVVLSCSTISCLSSVPRQPCRRAWVAIRMLNFFLQSKPKYFCSRHPAWGSYRNWSARAGTVRAPRRYPEAPSGGGLCEGLLRPHRGCGWPHRCLAGSPNPEQDVCPSRHAPAFT